MELFSEIYSAYYNVTSEILSKLEISQKDMEILIRKKAFSESILYLMPKLTDTQNGWKLLKKLPNGKYKSVLKNCPKMPISLIEKRWLKSLLLDDKVKLFLDDTTIDYLNKRLHNVKPLYDNTYFYYFDRSTNDDNFLDKNYIINFRNILKSIKDKSILKINGLEALPLKIEYSNKENCFRLYLANILNDKISHVDILNIKDIKSIENTNKKYHKSVDCSQILNYNKCKTPIILEIYPQRNSLERFMMEFAKYEKHTELDNSTGICTAKIWYDISNQDELIIKILSFGCTIKVISPSDVVNIIKSAINEQYNILCQK